MIEILIMKSKYILNRNLFLLILMMLVYPTYSYSQDKKIEVLGTPFVKVESNSNTTTRYELTKKQNKEYQLIITDVGGRFYWESRGGKELLKSNSGIYNNYVSPVGAGYIKVSTMDNTYIEHIHQGLNTLTYWGIVQK